MTTNRETKRLSDDIRFIAIVIVVVLYCIMMIPVALMVKLTNKYIKLKPKPTRLPSWSLPGGGKFSFKTRLHL